MFMPQRGQREPLATSVLFSNLRDTRADSLVTGTKKWEQEGSGKTQGPNLHWPAQCPVGQAAVHSHLKRSGLHWALQTPENQLDPFLADFTGLQEPCGSAVFPRGSEQEHPTSGRLAAAGADSQPAAICKYSPKTLSPSL